MLAIQSHDPIFLEKQNCFGSVGYQLPITAMKIDMA